MTEQHTPSPRSRLQALQAIPDNQRTEEQWDELHELEITLAPGNRIGHQEKQGQSPGQGKGRGGGAGNQRGGNSQGPARGENRGGGRSGRNSQGQRPQQASGPRPAVESSAPSAPVEGGVEVVVDGAAAKKPFRRFHKKPPKPAAT
jgi:hypothetical protein